MNVDILFVSECDAVGQEDDASEEQASGRFIPVRAQGHLLLQKNLLIHRRHTR